MNTENHRIAVLGLGYVGLPVALALAEKFLDVLGFDINRDRIHDLKAGIDTTKEVESHTLTQTSLHLSD
ncbi:MAG: NAD(P)-binding domain-containing protein, partial [Sphaerospermopsis kisseleviana]